MMRKDNQPFLKW